MLIVSVWYSVKEGAREQMKQLCKDAMENTRKEEGCVSYTHYASMENEGDFFVHEVWRSKADQEHHIQMPYVKEFQAKREPILVQGSHLLVEYDQADETLRVGKKRQ